MMLDTQVMSQFKKIKISDNLPLTTINIEEAVLNILNYIKHKNDYHKMILVIKSTDLFTQNMRRISILSQFTKNILFENEELQIDRINNFIDLVNLITNKIVDLTFLIKHYLCELLVYSFTKPHLTQFAEIFFNSDLNFSKDNYSLIIEHLEQGGSHKSDSYFDICYKFIDINRVDKDGLTYLNNAIINNDDEQIKKLLDLGAEKNVEMSLYNNTYMIIEKYKTYGKKYKKIVDQYFADKMEYNLEKLKHELYEHVSWNNIDKVKSILQTYHLNVDYLTFGNYPLLMYATTEKMVDLLLKYGANPNDIKGGMLVFCDEAVIKKLLQCGSDPQSGLSLIEKRIEGCKSEDRKINLEFRRDLIIKSYSEIKKQVSKSVMQDKENPFYKDIFDIVLNYL